MPLVINEKGIFACVQHNVYTPGKLSTGNSVLLK